MYSQVRNNPAELMKGTESSQMFTISSLYSQPSLPLEQSSEQAYAAESLLAAGAGREGEWHIA